jgi:hypothetical protein
MHECRDAGLRQDSGERRRVILVRMHASRRNQAHQVADAAALAQVVDQVAQRWRLADLAVRDRIRDALQGLLDDPAGPDVEVSDLGIAHLAGRQADIRAGGSQQGVRTGLPQAVEGRGAGLTDRIVGRLLAPAPAVQHGQHHRPALLRAAFLVARAIARHRGLVRV